MDFNTNEYAIFTCHSGIFQKDIEKDIDDTMYLHLTLQHNKKSFWTMLQKHCSRCFTVQEEQLIAGVGQYWDEIRFNTEFGKGFDLSIENDYLEQRITINVRLPYCNEAAQQFIELEPSEGRCIDELKNIIHAAAAAISVNDSYCPKTLLGN